jgi:type II secretion system F domain protein
LLKKLSLKKGENLGKQELNYNKYEYDLKVYLRYVAIALFYAMLFVYTFYRNIFLYFLSIPFCFLYPLIKKEELIQKRKKDFLLQFKEALLILSAFVSAGYSIENSIKESINELKLIYGETSLIVSEFSLLNNKLKINKSIEQAIEELADRVAIEEVSNFSMIIRIAKRSGGNLIDIFERSIKVISDKISIKEEIITFISSKIFEQKIMNIFPIIMILYINFSSPNYFKTMYTSLIGRVVMSISLLIYILAIYVSKKIMDIRV